MSPAAFSLILLLLKSSKVRVTVLCKAWEILMVPTDMKLFPFRYSFCKLIFRDKTSAMSSAASSLMSLLETFNILNSVTFFRPFAIIIAPVNCKLFPLRFSSCSLVL